MKEQKEKQMCQWVVIEFSDGSTAGFSGEAVCFPGKENRSITGIKFTVPEELPAGCSLEPLI